MQNFRQRKCTCISPVRPQFQLAWRRHPEWLLQFAVLKNQKLVTQEIARFTFICKLLKNRTWMNSTDESFLTHIYIYIFFTTWRVLVPALQCSKAGRTFTDTLQVDSLAHMNPTKSGNTKGKYDRCSDPQKWYKPGGWFYHKPLLSSKSGLQSQKRERSKGTERYKIITGYRRDRFQ